MEVFEFQLLEGKTRDFFAKIKYEKNNSTLATRFCIFLLRHKSGFKIFKALVFERTKNIIEFTKNKEHNGKTKTVENIEASKNTYVFLIVSVSRLSVFLFSHYCFTHERTYPLQKVFFKCSNLKNNFRFTLIFIKSNTTYFRQYLNQHLYISMFDCRVL